MSRIDDMLAEARAQIVRYTPQEASLATDVLIVDLRPDDVRARTGVIAGSIAIARSVLEWRADPTCEWHDPALAGKRLLLVCDHGFSSSLAAASLVALGVDAADLVGGFEGWVEAGLPVQ